MSSVSPILLDSTDSLEIRARRCRLTTSRVISIKDTLVARYRLEGTPMPLVREAIASAESLAWLTGFPHLFLPGLADEILDQLRQKEGSFHPEFAEAA